MDLLNKAVGLNARFMELELLPHPCSPLSEGEAGEAMSGVSVRKRKHCFLCETEPFPSLGFGLMSKRCTKQLGGKLLPFWSRKTFVAFWATLTIPGLNYPKPNLAMLCGSGDFVN